MSSYGNLIQSARKGYVDYFPSAVRHKYTGKEAGAESTCWPTSLMYRPFLYHSFVFFIISLREAVYLRSFGGMCECSIHCIWFCT